MPNDDDLLESDLIGAVERLSDVFAGKSIRYALIGGIATFLRGRPRFTQDVDILLDVPQLVLPGLLDDLIAADFTLDRDTAIREYVREHITQFRYGTVRIDWLKPILPLYVRALADASPIPWTKGHSIRVATAEGLILTKMIAFRAQDQADIEALLAANRDKIDLNLIRQECSQVPIDDQRIKWLETKMASIVADRPENPV